MQTEREKIWDRWLLRGAVTHFCLLCDGPLADNKHYHPECERMHAEDLRAHFIHMEEMLDGAVNAAIDFLDIQRHGGWDGLYYWPEPDDE